MSADILTPADAASLLVGITMKSPIGKKLLAISSGETRVVRTNPLVWKPIDQRDTYDCERCCFAMMLGIAYEEVPYFYQIYKRTQRDERRAWLRKNFGLDYVAMRTDGGPLDLPWGAYCIAGVASPTGNLDGHAVFGKIERHGWTLLHDPSPQREKSGKAPYEFQFFVPALEVAS